MCCFSVLERVRTSATCTHYLPPGFFFLKLRLDRLEHRSYRGALLLKREEFLIGVSEDEIAIAAPVEGLSLMCWLVSAPFVILHVHLQAPPYRRIREMAITTVVPHPADWLADQYGRNARLSESPWSDLDYIPV